MKLIRTAAMIGIAKRLFDEGRKPENQRRIKQGVDSVRARYDKSSTRKPPTGR